MTARLRLLLGGAAETSLTGQVLGMDVAPIVTLHATRVFLVTAPTPSAFRLLHRGGDG